MAGRSKVTRGLMWSAIERIGQVFFAFLVQLILARLLSPEEFGLIAMVAVFIAVSRAIVDSGFTVALIQKDKVEDDDVSTAFVFNLIASLLVALLLFLIASPVANFYGQPRLSEILPWLALSVLFGSLGSVHNSLLVRELAFQKIVRATLPATLLSGIIGIMMAYLGLGVWALVVQNVLQQAIVSALLLIQSHWRFSLRFSRSSFAAMFPYGVRLAIAGVLEQIFQNVYILVIGKTLTPAEVGYYQRARIFQQLPVSNIQAVLGRVLLPVFAAQQNDKDRLLKTMRKALKLSALIVLPFMAFMSATASPMILSLIGDKWLPAAPILQLLCIAGATYPISIINLSYISSIGRSDIYLNLEVCKKLLVVINVLCTYQFGVMAMVKGMLIVSLLSTVLNTIYTAKSLYYGLINQVKDLLAIIVMAAVIFACGSILTTLYWSNSWIELLVCAFQSIIIVIVGLRLLGKDFRIDLKRSIENLLPKWGRVLGCLL